MVYLLAATGRIFSWAIFDGLSVCPLSLTVQLYKSQKFIAARLWDCT